MPADAGAGIIPDEQRLNEVIDGRAGQLRGSLAQLQKPVRDRLCWRKAACVEVVTPPVGGRQPLAEPSLKSKRREFDAIDGGNECLLLRMSDAVLEQGQAGQARLGEEILLPARWSSALARSHVRHIGLGLDSRECGGLLPLCAHRFAFERLTAGGNGPNII